MQLPNKLTPAQRAAVIQCLRIAAARGRAIREAQEMGMPSSVSALDGGDKTRSVVNTSGIVCDIVGMLPARVNNAQRQDG